METKLTPGPWRVSDSEGINYETADEHYHYVCAGDGVYAKGKHIGFELSGCMSIDDARLIAAAPELFEALKQLRDAFLGTSVEVQADAMRNARAALAKATGEQA